MSNNYNACDSNDHPLNRAHQIQENYGKIRAVKATVGGYFGGYTNIEIDLEALVVKCQHGGNGHSMRVFSKVISPAAALQFIEQLKQIDLLKWKAKYVTPEVYDGTQWQVQIFTDGRTIKKYGDNKFPDQWEHFCKLMTEISGRRFR